MDSNHESTNGLPTPLEPAQLSTVEIKKSAPEKDWAPQNYVNVSIGEYAKEAYFTAWQN